MGGWVEGLDAGVGLFQGAMGNLTFGGLAGKGARAQGQGMERDRLARACEEFEAIFIEQIFKAMRRTVGSSETRQEAIYRSLFDEEAARVLARRGLGLKELLFNTLEQRQTRGLDDPALDAQVSEVPADKESAEAKSAASAMIPGNQE
jgi:flagellar protein FlgJ